MEWLNIIPPLFESFSPVLVSMLHEIMAGHPWDHRESAPSGGAELRFRATDPKIRRKVDHGCIVDLKDSRHR